MKSKDFKYPDTQAYNFVVSRLESLGVTIADIAEIAYQQQHQFGTIPLTQAEYVPVVEDVMHKRELLNNAMVMLELDRLANEKQLESPLQEIIANDSAVFGVDETLALQIANLYGSIGVTNFGFVDYKKTGVIKHLDTNADRVNTFADDLVGAIAAAVCGKLVHKYS